MADALYYATKFAIGTYDQIEPAIKDGTLSYPAYVYVSDTEQLAFINKDLSVDIIRGAAQVLRVDELPPIEDGDQDIIYIYDNNVYVFTGEAYRPMYSDISGEVLTEIVELNEKVSAIEDEVKALAQVVENISDGSSGLVFEEYENFPKEGMSNQLYIDINGNMIYRYDDMEEAYIPIPDIEDLNTADLPIETLTGMADDVINVSALESGTYFVTGYYKIYDEDDVITTSEYIPFLVSRNEEGIFITEFKDGEITKHEITNSGDVKDCFATKDYVQEYVEETVLGAMKERY